VEQGIGRSGPLTAGEFAAWVRQQRRIVGLTQEELAERAGISPRTVRNVEHGERGGTRPHTRRVIMAAFAAIDAASAGSHPGPAQLPADIGVFVGRTAELAALDGIAGSTRLARQGSRPHAIPIAAISGPPGWERPRSRSAGRTASAPSSRTASFTSICAATTPNGR
jgi:transcriptional regulator with XRE-family HTH domain